MPTRIQSRPGRLCETLESRRLLASAGQLLAYDFNSAAAWPAAAVTGSTGVTGTTTQSAVGTIDVEGDTVASGGENFVVTAAPASGVWDADFTSGKIAVTNTETNLGKLTLGFSLSASQTKTVKVRVYSYNASGGVTGALEAGIVPASAGSFQRYSVDFSDMKPMGSGSFSPTAPFVSFDFDVASASGWSASGTPTLRLDNLQYSKPALYVSSIDGSNSDNGKTEATAFLTIQKAIDASLPGDIILIKGDAAHPYTVSAGNRNLITHGGTPAAWVSFKNYPGQAPLIYNEGWSALQIGAISASTAAAIGYVEVRGLHVQGDSAKVGTRSAPDGAYDPTAANADQYGPYAQYIQPIDPATGKNSGGSADSRTNGNGISVSGGNEQNKPHDIRIANNLVEQCAGGGVGAGSADRVQIEDNVVRDNCYWDKYATSGISILSTYNFDGTSGAVTRLVRGNVSSGNIHKEKWVRNDPVLTQYSDGNGIIIDTNHDSGGTALGRTLVTNNVSYDNGGSGIHTYNADHVDIVNNTAYLNSASPYLQYGEIFSQSNDVRIYNNIMVALVAPAGSPAEYVTGGNTPSSSNQIFYKYNVYFGGNIQPAGANTYNVGNVTADPKFVLASVNSAVANFRLQPTSPAINLGTTSLAPSLDITSARRYGNPDSGAYEYTPPVPTLIALTAASDTGTAGDNRTRLNNGSTANRLSFVVSGTVSGAVVQLYANAVLVGTATAGGTITTVTTDGVTAIASGAALMTAVQTFAGAPSDPSTSLPITVDTSLPTVVGTPVVNANLGADLAASRSVVQTITWTFSEPVLATVGNFVLTNTTTGQPVSLASRAIAVSGNVVTLTLDRAGDPLPGLFLANGQYTLSLSPTVTDVAGNPLDANGDGAPGETPTFSFFKLLADINGDRQVDFNDFLILQNAFGKNSTTAGYNAASDLNGDNQVDFNDFLVLQNAFGSSVAAARTPVFVAAKTSRHKKI